MTRPDIQATIRALSKAQRRVLDMIAVDQDIGHNPRTIATLISKGMIETYEKTINLDRFGPIAILRFRVPNHVRIAWCEVCSAEVGDG